MLAGAGTTRAGSGQPRRELRIGDATREDDLLDGDASAPTVRASLAEQVAEIAWVVDDGLTRTIAANGIGPGGQAAATRATP